MVSKVLFSSTNKEWVTPNSIFIPLNMEFQFTLDAAASESNKKCKDFFSKENDGLSHSWYGNVWVNPPYGRQVGEWLKKAVEEIKSHANVIVMLLPARTDTSWWHNYIIPHAYEVRFMRGRIKFDGAKAGAPFPSAIVVFRREEVNE